MKTLAITRIEKDAGSITPTGDFRLKIHFTITGTDGSADSKVMFIGQFRPSGSLPHVQGSSIYSDKMHIPAGSDPVAILPFSGYIPHNSEVSVWGLIDTDFRDYRFY